MKKIKYLIGLFLFGLIFNYGFCDTLNIELVNTHFDDGVFDNGQGFLNQDYRYSYSYLFKQSFENSCFTYENQRRFDGYGVYYYNTRLIDRFYKAGRNSNVCYSSVLWNNSYLGIDSYNGWCPDVGGGSYYYVNTNVSSVGSSYSDPNACIAGNHIILLGRNNNFGKVFTAIDKEQSSPSQYPKFGFGDGYFTNNDYLEVKSDQINRGLRLFYNSLTGGYNGLYDMDFVFPSSGYNLPVHSWEFFTNTQTRTNYGYIIDSNGWKGKHFGSLGLGYSFVYNKDQALSGGKISWNTLGFGTVRDEMAGNLKSFGGLDLVNADYTDFYTDGILILRKNQYTNNGEDGMIMISKDPDNVKGLLYQEFSCQTNNFKCLFYGLNNSGGSWSNNCPNYFYPSGNPNDYTGNGNSYNPCLVLSQGYLTYNGSTDFLPFNNKNGLVNIADDTFLSYLFNNDSSLGDVYTYNNQLCFGNNQCFGKVNGNSSIKENYLNGVYNNPYEYITTGEISNGLYELCSTNAYFAAVNYEVCHGVNPSNIVNISGVQYIVADIQYPDGLIIKQTIPLDSYNDGTYITNAGIEVSVCSEENPCYSSSSGSVYFSGGILDIGYYDFNNTGLFFSCPYPYNSLLSLKGWNLNIGNFDIIGPINCMIAGFKHGKSFDVFDNVGLFEFGPLMNGNTQQHRILFRFFDFILILGFILFFSLIYKRFK